MRLLFAALLAAASTAAIAAPAKPSLTPAQRASAHEMFEHVINTPTVIGRHKVPEMAAGNVTGLSGAVSANGSCGSESTATVSARLSPCGV